MSIKETHNAFLSRYKASMAIMNSVFEDIKQTLPNSRERLEKIEKIKPIGNDPTNIEEVQELKGRLLLANENELEELYKQQSQKQAKRIIQELKKEIISLQSSRPLFPND